MAFVREKSELEKIVEFAEKRNMNMYEVCVIYGGFRELDRVSGENNAYNRTMEYIFNNS